MELNARTFRILATIARDHDHMTYLEQAPDAWGTRSADDADERQAGEVSNREAWLPESDALSSDRGAV